MAEEDLDQVELRELVRDDSFTGFSMGDAAFNALKIFARKHAKSYAEQMLAKTYVAVEGKKIVGYVTLVCGQIEINTGQPAPDVGNADYRFDHYPAMKIARLAVDHRYRGSGLGRTLLEFSLGLARDTVAVAVGCRFVVLDAKKGSVAFYEKNGFRLVDTEANRDRPQPVMFLDLKAASA